MNPINLLRKKLEQQKEMDDGITLIVACCAIVMFLSVVIRLRSILKPAADPIKDPVLLVAFGALIIVSVVVPAVACPILLDRYKTTCGAVSSMPNLERAFGLALASAVLLGIPALDLCLDLGDLCLMTLIAWVCSDERLDFIAFTSLALLDHAVAWIDGQTGITSLVSARRVRFVLATGVFVFARYYLLRRFFLSSLVVLAGAGCGISVFIVTRTIENDGERDCAQLLLSVSILAIIPCLVIVCASIFTITMFTSTSPRPEIAKAFLSAPLFVVSGVASIMSWWADEPWIVFWHFVVLFVAMKLCDGLRSDARLDCFSRGTRFLLSTVETIAAVALVAVWAWSAVRRGGSVRHMLGLTSLTLVVVQFAASLLWDHFYGDGYVRRRDAERWMVQVEKENVVNIEWSQANERAFDSAARTVPFVRDWNLVDAAETRSLWHEFLAERDRETSRQQLRLIRDCVLRLAVSGSAEHVARVVFWAMRRRDVADASLEDQPACLICNRIFCEGQEITETPCGHAFCSDPCSRNWFRDGRHRCPTCGADVVSVHHQVEVYSAETLRTLDVHVINTGSSAIVYRASGGLSVRGVPTDVALKVYLHSGVRFLERELRYLNSLRHEHVLYAVGVCRDADLPCIVMPLLTPLVDGSCRSVSVIQHMSLGQRLLLCRDVAAAIEFIHSRGKTHRDIKPQNILLRAEQTNEATVGGDESGSNNKLRAVLGDLGSIRTAQGTHATAVFTAMFCAPEIFAIACRHDRPSSIQYVAADIYSAGLSFSCVLLAQLPHDTTALVNLLAGNCTLSLSLRSFSHCFVQ